MPRSPVKLRPEFEQQIGEFAARHPERTSRCGVVLAEILASRDTKERTRAAFVYFLLGCKRGLKSLERELWMLVERVRQGPGNEISHDEWYLLSVLLQAIGRIDTPESHALIRKLIDRAESVEIIAWALDGTAYEERTFDRQLSLRWLSIDAPPRVIHSALFSLIFHGYAHTHPDEARQRIVPLLEHPDDRVRAYAIWALSAFPSNIAIILELQEDSSEEVLDAVKEALNVYRLLTETGDVQDH